MNLEQGARLALLRVSEHRHVHNVARGGRWRRFDILSQLDILSQHQAKRARGSRARAFLAEITAKRTPDAAGTPPAHVRAVASPRTAVGFEQGRMQDVSPSQWQNARWTALPCRPGTHAHRCGEKGFGRLGSRWHKPCAAISLSNVLSDSASHFPAQAARLARHCGRHRLHSPH